MSLLWNFLCTKNPFKLVLRLILRIFLTPEISLSKHIKMRLNQSLSASITSGVRNVLSEAGDIAV